MEKKGLLDDTGYEKKKGHELHILSHNQQSIETHFLQVGKSLNDMPEYHQHVGWAQGKKKNLK